MISSVSCNQSHLIGKDEVVFVYNKQMSPLHYHFFLREFPLPSSEKINWRGLTNSADTIWSKYSLPSPPLSHRQPPPLNQDQAVQA